MSRAWEFAKKGAAIGAVIGAVVVGIAAASCAATLGLTAGVAFAAGAAVGAFHGGIHWGIIGAVIGAFTKDKPAETVEVVHHVHSRSAAPCQGAELEQEQGCTKFRDAVATAQSQAVCR